MSNFIIEPELETYYQTLTKTTKLGPEQAGTECGTNKVLLVVTHRLKDGDATEKLAEALTPALILI